MHAKQPSAEHIKNAQAELGYPDITISGIYNSHILGISKASLSHVSVSKVSLFAAATCAAAIAIQQYSQENSPAP